MGTCAIGVASYPPSGCSPLPGCPSLGLPPGGLFLLRAASSPVCTHCFEVGAIAGGSEVGAGAP
jgi:hypothetical protein